MKKALKLGLTAIVALSMPASYAMGKKPEQTKVVPEIMISKSDEILCVEAQTPASYVFWCSDDKQERMKIKRKHKSIYMYDEDGDGLIENLQLKQDYKNAKPKIFSKKRDEKLNQMNSETARYLRSASDLFAKTKQNLNKYVDLEEELESLKNDKPSKKTWLDFMEDCKNNWQF